MIGVAPHRKGDYEQALEVHIKAAGFPATAPAGMYNAGMACARLGDPDRAFEWLGRRATPIGWT